MRSDAIKGPGLKIELDVRRLWGCGSCGYRAKLPGNRVACRCPQCADVAWMRLVEPQRRYRAYVVPQPTDMDAGEFDDGAPAIEPEPLPPETANEVVASDSTAAEIDLVEASPAAEPVETDLAEANPPPALTEAAPPESAADQPAADSKREPSKSRKRRNRRRRRRDNDASSPPAKSEGETAAAPTPAESVPEPRRPDDAQPSDRPAGGGDGFGAGIL